ncbi:RloB family protein [Streptosporangium lutulentum]
MVNVDDHMTLGQALVDARRGKVNLVVSFPCFELWVLYHFQDYPVSTNRIEIRRKLKRHLPEYDKHLGLDFPFERYATAQQRAEKADPDHCEPNRRGSNPSTNVWLVVETIRQAGRPV